MYEISHMLGNKRGSVLLKFHFPTPLLPPLSPLFTLPCAARLEESRRGEPGAAGPQLPAGTPGSGHGGGDRGLEPPGLSWSTWRAESFASRREKREGERGERGEYEHPWAY